ncbi:hypothetical protein BYT27DRAFT_6392084 [Phlegmacium glaucopus]|nr:hypothetical protein BYT27DRAFT_6392084 [Phlegmacium glaucopus]
MAHVESDSGESDSGESDPQSADTMLGLQSASDSEGCDSEEGGPVPAIYRVSELMPLSTFSAWDEINASLDVRLTGPNSLKGLYDEADFARSHLKKTSSALVKGLTPAKAALFCVKQIQAEGITEDLRIAFAKLLPHLLWRAEQSPELEIDILGLQNQFTLYQRLPLKTQKAIADYLGDGFPKPTRHL